MKLDLSKLSEITAGAVMITEEKDGFGFNRFTSEQQELYRKRNQDFYIKSFSSSGIKFHFKTNSKSLFLKAIVSNGSSRTYFSFDIFVNGKMVDSINNFSAFELPQNYACCQFPLGEFSKSFAFEDGEKEICIYLPWSVKAVIREISLDDGAFIEPIKLKNKLLSFGDSITQGYDALYPSNKYITRLANALNADEYNKAIGGEVFFPELASTKESFAPDFITVAYGTNDWNKCTKEEFLYNCSEFFSNLTAVYPNTRIFAITPIWRKEIGEYRKFGKFEEVEEIIQNIAKGFANVTVISGFDFLPQEEKYFGDLRLHPNDEGFKCYFSNLYKNLNL